MARGHEFEREIFDHASSGLLEVCGQIDFATDVLSLVDGATEFFPNTNIGRSLHSLVAAGLKRRGVDPTGLLFVNALDTKVDVHHFSDGIFFLPDHTGGTGFVVTVDAFYIDTQQLKKLKEGWFRDFGGEFYSHLNFQTDLFLHKSGWSNWCRAIKRTKTLPYVVEGSGKRSIEIRDFRILATRGRPENHLVLTPYHLRSRVQRRVFARLVTDYLATETIKKMAPLSH